MKSLMGIFVLCFIMSCGGGGSSAESFSNGDGEYFGEITCMHKAIMAAIILAEKGYTTKMVCWTINENGFSHIQTAALIDGEWEYFCIGNDGIVYPHGLDYDNPSEERDSYRFSDGKVEYIGMINDYNSTHE